MQIKEIHSMRWAAPDHTFVVLAADTDTGDNEQISTPYSDESIIWEAVQAFPVADIEAYVEPPPPKPEKPWSEGIIGYQWSEDTVSWEPVYAPAEPNEPPQEQP